MTAVDEDVAMNTVDTTLDDPAARPAVLLVSRDPRLAGLRVRLWRDGMEPVQATSAQEAENLLALRPDMAAALLDAELPTSEAFRAYRLLHRPRVVPTVVLLPEGVEPSAWLGEVAGPLLDEYAQKPIAVDRLSAQIQSLLARVGQPVEAPEVAPLAVTPPLAAPEAPPEELGEEKRRRRRLIPIFPWRPKALVAALLLLALGWVLFISYQYYETRKPIAELPGVPGVAVALAKQPPSYVQAFYGPAEAPLASPLGVAVSPNADRIYATESAGERATLVFDRAGKVVGKLVPPNTEPGGRFPLYVAVDAGGTVYISDRLRGVIDMYSPSGDYQGTYKPKESPPEAPLALFFDKAGSFCVTDVPQGEHRLLVYDQEGKLKLSIGKEGSAPGQLSFPNGVAVDSRGNIYVSDSNNSRVEIFDKDGKFLDVIGRGGKGTLGISRGIAVDGLGRLFIVDTTGQVVEVWDVTGEPKRLYTIGSQGLGDAQFYYPNGIALDSTGRVYVTDRMNNRVQVWSY